MVTDFSLHYHGLIFNCTRMPTVVFYDENEAEAHTPRHDDQIVAVPAIVTGGWVFSTSFQPFQLDLSLLHRKSQNFTISYQKLSKLFNLSGGFAVVFYMEKKTVDEILDLFAKANRHSVHQRAFSYPFYQSTPSEVLPKTAAAQTEYEKLEKIVIEKCRPDTIFALFGLSGELKCFSTLRESWDDFSLHGLAVAVFDHEGATKSFLKISSSQNSGMGTDYYLKDFFKGEIFKNFKTMEKVVIGKAVQIERKDDLLEGVPAGVSESKAVPVPFSGQEEPLPTIPRAATVTPSPEEAEGSAEGPPQEDVEILLSGFDFAALSEKSNFEMLSRFALFQNGILESGASMPTIVLYDDEAVAYLPIRDDQNLRISAIVTGGWVFSEKSKAFQFSLARGDENVGQFHKINQKEMAESFKPFGLDSAAKFAVVFYEREKSVEEILKFIATANRKMARKMNLKDYAVERVTPEVPPSVTLAALAEYERLEKIVNEKCPPDTIFALFGHWDERVECFSTLKETWDSFNVQNLALYDHRGASKCFIDEDEVVSYIRTGHGSDYYLTDSLKAEILKNFSTKKVVIGEAFQTVRRGF